MHSVDAATLLSAVGRGLLLLGLLLVTGWLAAYALRETPAVMTRTALVSIAPWLLVTGAALMLGGQLVALEVFAADGMPFGATLRALLLSTGWGTAWSAFALFGLLLAVTGTPHALAQALVPILLGTLPFLGHGGAAFGAEPLVYCATVLHAVTAAAWLGTLAHAAPGWWRNAATVSVARYRRLARAAAPAALAAGAFLAWHRTGGLAGGLPALPSSTWGRLLLAKVALALLALALGAWHHRRLGRPDAMRSIGSVRTTLVAELLLAIALVACTGWLAQSEPPV